MKKLIHITIFLCLISFVEAGQISGKIQLKENGQLRTEQGEVFVGEVNSENEDKFQNFPDYLIAMIDSLKNQRRSEIAKNGEFLIEKVPVNKKIIVGISFTGVKCFFEKTLTEEGILIIDETIELNEKSQPFSIDVKNETGLVFRSDFSAISYLVSDGLSGRVFVGNKSNGDTIDFGEVPLGSYKVYVLNEVGEDKPNRVDVMSVAVVNNDDQESVIFEVK